MKSARVPGKVLRQLAGRPLLGHLLDRLCTLGMPLVVATSDDRSDDAIASFCVAEGVAVHRGPLDDVAARFVGAARERGIDPIVRVSGDSPLLDPAIVRRALELWEPGLLVTNVRPRSFPTGQSVEVFELAALERAELTPEAREHVTTHAPRAPAGEQLLAHPRPVGAAPHARHRGGRGRAWTRCSRVWTARRPTTPSPRSWSCAPGRRHRPRRGRAARRGLGAPPRLRGRRAVRLRRRSGSRRSGGRHPEARRFERAAELLDGGRRRGIDRVVRLPPLRPGPDGARARHARLRGEAALHDRGRRRPSCARCARANPALRLSSNLPLRRSPRFVDLRERIRARRARAALLRRARLRVRPALEADRGLAGPRARLLGDARRRRPPDRPAALADRLAA